MVRFYENLRIEVFLQIRIIKVRGEWRGIGTIPESGYALKEAYSAYDAGKRFRLQEERPQDTGECIAGAILKGQKKPHECPHFGKKCTPRNPLGAPMVSSEGACAAYYHFASTNA